MSEVRQAEQGSSFRHTCPHCQTRQVSFGIVGGLVYLFYDSEGTKMATLAGCGHCSRPVMATFKGNNPARMFLRSPLMLDPSPAPKAPEHTPDSVARRYKEALANVGSDAFESAVMMFRKTLQLALRTVRPKEKGDLVSQIRSAAAAGAISKDLADSADAVRLGGNIAAHEDTTFTLEEARELQQFTDMVLMYLFTLPEMLNRWKKAVAAKGK